MIEFFLVLFLMSFRSEALGASSAFLLEDTAVRFEDILRPALPGDLTIIFEHQDDRTNAELTKAGELLTIRVWGGMLNHSLMTEDTLLLLLCHEIGHFLGGAPTKSRGGWSSTEGQADYYSSYQCARHVGLDEVSFYDSAINLTRIYASVMFSPEPRLDSCDESVVSRTNFGYPSVQCRLDTLVAGWKKLPRPQCWFWQ